MESIKEITDDTSDSWSNISKTGQSIAAASTQISRMIDLLKVIDEVSMRINLIALNASIEAVHVGEKGKGFTIIAKEIRKLSDLTSRRLVDIMQAINRVHH
jgi:methyl-accepting chemotaxis protein